MERGRDYGEQWLEDGLLLIVCEIVLLVTVSYSTSP